MNKTPNLFIIGAMKSGSTTLYSHLKAHPEIFLSAIKEPHYFVEELNWSKGSSWYESLYDEAKGEKYLGEASTTYSMKPRFPSVPEKIKDYCHSPKFIYIIREPIDRIVSHYRHFVRWHGERRDFETTVQENQHWIEYGRYMSQLKPYIEIFGKENIHVVVFENMVKAPQEEITKVFRFLELSEFSIGQTSKHKNRTPDKISASPVWFENGVVSTVIERLSPMVPAYIKTSIKTRLYKTFEIDPSQVAKLRKKTKSIFQEDSDELKKILDLDLSAWHKDEAS